MTTKDLFDEADEVIEQYIERAYEKLVGSGFLPLVDEPIEDSPKFDLVCEVAQELYEDFLDNNKV